MPTRDDELRALRDHARKLGDGLDKMLKPRKSPQALVLRWYAGERFAVKDAVAALKGSLGDQQVRRACAAIAKKPDGEFVNVGWGEYAPRVTS